MSPFIFITIAGLDATAIGFILFPVSVVVDALLCFWSAQDGTWEEQEAQLNGILKDQEYEPMQAV